MKNFSILTLIQAVMSLISAILISKMSFIGKIGVSTASMQCLKRGGKQLFCYL